MMLLKDLNVFQQIGQDLYMIAKFGRTQTWELWWPFPGQIVDNEGYGTAPWLMTPYKGPLNAPQEQSYINYLKRERMIIESCFG